MNLIIDVGNTRVKTAVFEKDKLKELFFFNKGEIFTSVKEITKKFPIQRGIISAVAKLTDEKIEKLKGILNLITLDNETKVPFINKYETPKTLGVDRIALAAYAISNHPNKNVLVIDAGTCVTFDFVNAQGEYLGGAISPGLKMRYQSLNNYTSKLPLLNSKEPNSFIGKNTQESIHSGVVNGISREIDGVITQYKNKFGDLTVLLTGGDTNFLVKQLKNDIFANPNLVLEGLHQILTYNRADD
ncbi:type III pantothenate kinase [Tenacibaculum jejuense]|uniref:Type III pantothenate kinase n=1 Tax=Tenacibaculum jejuense TaxID=584609 RepID=A0A238UFA7_9FLAO|nr:type III pantothenate kinase [Tenacibaculum jejuense]SNR17154.1 Type III pantothenate kinase [Tenacibaculum jejuense]